MKQVCEWAGTDDGLEDEKKKSRAEMGIAAG